MKINEKMRYPHPVLSEFSSDYLSGDLSAEFTLEQTEDDQLKITSEILIGNPELASLITAQEAGSGYFLVSRRTFFNHLQEVPPGTCDKYFNLTQLHGLVTVRPIVWTLDELIGFSSPLIDAEFGDDIRIRKGSIIAMGPEFRFSIDPRKFKPFETIFKLAVDDTIPPGMIEIDTDDDKIGILAEPKTHAALESMRNTDITRSVMLSSVYMPVVADIVAQIRQKDKSLEARRWFQVFAAKCDDMGIEIEDPSASALGIAQKLLKAPLREMTKAVENTA